MRENDGQVNIHVGVLSGSLQKEVTLNFFITDLNAFGNILKEFTIFHRLFMQLKKIMMYHKCLH